MSIRFIPNAWAKIRSALVDRLIPNATAEFKRLWSIRIGLIFGALNGAMLGLSAFAGVIDPWWFLILNIVGWMVLIGARLLKQPGADA